MSLEIKQHNCDHEKLNIEQYKKPIADSGYSLDEINLIWDFYVTHSPCDMSSQSILFSTYGWEGNDKVKGLGALEKLLEEKANIVFNITRAKKIQKSIQLLELNDFICTQCPRSVMLQNASVIISEEEEITFNNNEPRINCIFRHIRNALAHGNTYFFDNKFVLLEDKDGQKITARILISTDTLIDWIKIVDKDKQYYFKDA